MTNTVNTTSETSKILHTEKILNDFTLDFFKENVTSSNSEYLASFQGEVINAFLKNSNGTILLQIALGRENLSGSYTIAMFDLLESSMYFYTYSRKELDIPLEGIFDEISSIATRRIEGKSFMGFVTAETQHFIFQEIDHSSFLGGSTIIDGKSWNIIKLDKEINYIKMYK